MGRRQRERLTALAVTRHQKPGRYADGGGLYLQVAPGGSRSWIFRYTLAARSHEMGLGPHPDISLAEARKRAATARIQLVDKIDPLEMKRAVELNRRLEASQSMTFAVAAEQYISAQEASWRNEKHRAQWRSTIRTYANPIIGNVPVASVDTPLVLKILECERLWTAKPETASRVRGRLASILDWATARGYRQGDNPARWQGHLSKILPARSKVRGVKHHAALPFDQISEFMHDLHKHEGNAARALELTILVALRTSEVIKARRPEIDLASKVWTVPAERMKAGREHRVPLSDRALEVISALPRENEWLFPGAKHGPMSNMAMLKVLERMERTDITVHGFRSTFRDWAAERTNFPNHVVEMALAHTIGDRVEAAYRRGDLFEKRRLLMEAWSQFVISRPPTVVRLIA